MLNNPPSSARSPKRSFAQINANPGISLPSTSILLPTNKKVRIDPNLSSDESVNASARQAIAASPQATAAGERESSSDQSGAKWFRRANENVEGPAKKPTRREDESPFYMTHQKRYEPSHNLRSINAESFGPLGRGDSENDELRGVIDDLTVENKKLKSLLRTRQCRARSASSDPDRVIEVRTHGLPPEKKRELEQILKTFATGVASESASEPSGGSTPSVGKLAPGSGDAHVESFVANKPPGLDHTNTDSGYASISNSAIHSTSNAGDPRMQEAENKSRKDSDIKSYLHDIPDSLFPQNTVSVSESTKMELVVQRLEQLFTGKLAVPGEHSLPLQQQKISRSAAKADRREDVKLNRTSKPEGAREAHILPPDSSINLDSIPQDNGQRAPNPSANEAASSATPGSSLDHPGTPDQRPTRPLDLDIHRAQVAVDNIRYIQHLGFSSPQFGNTQEQPWMYLNLLMSMAQLHTLNVTPAFIRKAVKAKSTKFELSKDGHKIRWKGDPNKMSGHPTEPSPAAMTQNSVEDAGDEAGRRSARSAASTINEAAPTSLLDGKASPSTSHGLSKREDSTATSSNVAVGQPSALSSKSSSFDYKPIVYRGKKHPVKGHKSYLDSSSSSGDVSPDPAGPPNALGRTGLGHSPDSREGFLTIFSNPHFCIDLSGEKLLISSRTDVHPHAEAALGISEKQFPEEDNLRDASACYFVVPDEEVQPFSLEQCPDLSWEIPPITSAGEDETQPMELEASGIGGVRPEDNFAIDVKVERTKVDIASSELTGRHKASRHSYRVIQATVITLQPSRLPPPSYVFFASSSSSGEQDYLDSDSTSRSSSEEDSPAPAGFLWKWSSSSTDQRLGEEYSEDSSLGALEAARARALNAAAAQVEDSDMIAAQAGATMSGSLAATAGASYSAASAADVEPAGREEDQESSNDMDCE
ncbi:Frequency clock protein [Exophiala dermatitidis]